VFFFFFKIENNNFIGDNDKIVDLSQ